MWTYNENSSFPDQQIFFLFLKCADSNLSNYQRTVNPFGNTSQMLNKNFKNSALKKRINKSSKNSRAQNDWWQSVIGPPKLIQTTVTISDNGMTKSRNIQIGRNMRSNALFETLICIYMFKASQKCQWKCGWVQWRFECLSRIGTSYKALLWLKLLICIFSSDKRQSKLSMEVWRKAALSVCSEKQCLVQHFNTYSSESEGQNCPWKCGWTVPFWILKPYRNAVFKWKDTGLSQPPPCSFLFCFFACFCLFFLRRFLF